MAALASSDSNGFKFKLVKKSDENANNKNTTPPINVTKLINLIKIFLIIPIKIRQKFMLS